MDRKEWLECEISELENKEMFVELGKIEKVFLKGFKSELGVIYEEENSSEG